MTKPPNSGTGRSLPDPDICRTKHRTGDIFDCLVKDPEICPYALSFGKVYFCQHPDRKKFEQTPGPSR